MAPRLLGGTDHPQRGFNETVEEEKDVHLVRWISTHPTLLLASIAAQLTSAFHPLDSSHSDTARIV